jgi:hypothetical protein
MRFGPIGECEICHEAHYFDTSAGRDYWIKHHMCKPVQVAQPWYEAME